MQIISLLSTGFSIISAFILFIVYLLFFKGINKSWIAITSCALLLIGLSGLQLWHLEFLLSNADLMLKPGYRFFLFMVPATFYFFSRAILMPAQVTKPVQLLHLVPLLFNFIGQYEIAITLIFVVGTGYSFWFASLVYHLRAQRKRFRIEMFFFGFFSVVAVFVLILGASIPYIDHGHFYVFYANSIGLCYLLIMFALLSNPDLLREFDAVASLSYASTTLKGINIESRLQKLEKLMSSDKIFQDENINLAIVAKEMELGSHQMSELINVHYRMSFSSFIREQRVQQAKELLVSEPESSILSISMETGFKSQSNFYAAFKSLTKQSPGDYRKSMAQ
ncbi:hypothetical protein MNBD_GAMMA12-2690 [hydrothermal vent metagenome]|uniref:HTH araC/xylS-type domain-containing protein n=1 Tax=hydrothermal vent metagenome TaxID=652676 RepID=A0A3B0YKK0_9ZZZZ